MTTDELNIWGDLDVSEISDDPFGIPNNTYWAICVDAKFQEKEGVTSFIIQWQIDQPGDEYDKNKISEYYTMYPGLKWHELDGDQKKRMKFLKLRLRRGFDLSETESANVPPSKLINKGAFITTKQHPSNDGLKTYTNVVEAVCKRLFEEEGGSVSQQNANELAKSIGM